MNAKTKAERILEYLLKRIHQEFPEEDGAFAVVISQPSYTSLNEGFEADPTADNTPAFVKADNEGWTPIARMKR